VARPTNFAHLSELNHQWLNAAHLSYLQMKQIFSLQSPLSTQTKFNQLKMPLGSLACLRQHCAADALVKLRDAIVSPIHKS
jgi:hypothetical protein